MKQFTVTHGAPDDYVCTGGSCSELSLDLHCQTPCRLAKRVTRGLFLVDGLTWNCSTNSLLFRDILLNCFLMMSNCPWTMVIPPRDCTDIFEAMPNWHFVAALSCEYSFSIFNLLDFLLDLRSMRSIWYGLTGLGDPSLIPSSSSWLLALPYCKQWQAYLMIQTVLIYCHCNRF